MPALTDVQHRCCVHLLLSYVHVAFLNELDFWKLKFTFVDLLYKHRRLILIDELETNKDEEWCSRIVIASVLVVNHSIYSVLGVVVVVVYFLPSCELLAAAAYNWALTWTTVTAEKNVGWYHLHFPTHSTALMSLLSSPPQFSQDAELNHYRETEICLFVDHPYFM